MFLLFLYVFGGAFACFVGVLFQVFFFTSVAFDVFWLATAHGPKVAHRANTKPILVGLKCPYRMKQNPKKAS